MTRHPFSSHETGADDPTLDRVAAELESFAARTGGDAPPDLTARILAAIDAEPRPSSTWWARMTAGLGPWRVTARVMAAAVVVVAAVVGAVALGDLATRVRPDVGSSPEPSPTLTESPAPSLTPSATPAPTQIPSPSATPTVEPTAVPSPLITPIPTASDGDDEIETPEPSESDRDNSGPGGGGSGGDD